MITLGKFTFKDTEVLSCINFMKKSNVIFSGTLSEEDFLKYNFKKPKILQNQNNLVTFINLEIDIEENDVVYCHLDYLELLFRLINKLGFSNIKVISTQSDRKITKKIFDQKPECISKWYSVNVAYNHPDLVPIPLGIASYRNTKSVIYADFIDLNHNKKVKDSIYTNFNVNTNYFHRIKAQKSISNNLHQNLKENSAYDTYLVNLHSSEYCIAPWGNGIDTHRFWESLYSETIPVTINCIHYQSFSDLPVLLLNSYDEIKNIQKDFNFLERSIEKLNIDWWISIIKNEAKTSTDKKKVGFTNLEIRILQIYFIKLKYRNKLLKIIFTLLRKIHKKFSILRKILPL